MTNILFHADAVEIAPYTSDDLSDVEFEEGDWGRDDYALVLGDPMDAAHLVGSLDQLQEVVDKLNQALVKIRRYDRSLARAKAKLDGRLKA